MANIQMQCLSERFITFTELNKNKRCDKRYPEQALQRFITLNHKTFSFLGVSVAIQEREGHVGLAFLRVSLLDVPHYVLPSMVNIIWILLLHLDLVRILQI